MSSDDNVRTVYIQDRNYVPTIDEINDVAVAIEQCRLVLNQCPNSVMVQSELETLIAELELYFQKRSEALQRG